MHVKMLVLWQKFSLKIMLEKLRSSLIFKTVSRVIFMQNTKSENQHFIERKKIFSFLFILYFVPTIVSAAAPFGRAFKSCCVLSPTRSIALFSLQGQCQRNTFSMRSGCFRCTPDVHVDTYGQEYFDLKDVRNKLVAFDPGLRRTAVCRSTIAQVDGVREVLRYRGCPIHRVVSFDYLRTALLLHSGFIVNEEQLQGCPEDEKCFFDLSQLVHQNRLTVKECKIIRDLFSCLPRIPINDMMVVGLRALHITDPNDESSIRSLSMLLAKVSDVAGLAYQHFTGQSFYLPRKTHYAENLLCTLRKEEDQFHPERVKIMNLILNLLAEHGLSNSTFAVRVACSAGTPLARCICVGIDALSGDKHGGASNAVLEMLQTIDNIGTIQYFQDVKNKKRRLAGFGHRIWKKRDLRVGPLKELLRTYLEKTTPEYHDIFQKACDLEEAVLTDSELKSKHLCANIDLYFPLALKLIGVDPQLSTTLFAVALTAGWSAHWNEQKESGELIRPQQLADKSPYDYLYCALPKT